MTDFRKTTRNGRECGNENVLTIREAMVKTGDLIDRILQSAPLNVRQMTSHLSLARGKGIRTLLLLACAADGDGLAPDDAVSAAAAVELFHLATLVHDDIIDDANLRRGIETVHMKFGKKDAVICGDYLLCLALSAITPLSETYYSDTNAGLFSVFAKSLGKTCLGELSEHQNNRNVDLSILQYLRIISGKTSALFYVAAYAGALVGQCDPKEARLLAKFGSNLGTIFQIVDDCKDYEFSEEKAQKPVNNDIMEGVVTLPLILAIQKDPALKDLALHAFDSAASAQLLHKKVCGAGALDSSRGIAEKYYRRAAKILGKVETANKRVALAELLEKALGASVSF